jgi:uncharacterized damage-inducible protein DinB
MRVVSKLQDEHIDFQAAETYMQSVGGILHPIIHLEEGWIHFVIRRARLEWPAEDRPGLTTIEATRDEMGCVHKETLDYLTSLPGEELSRVVQVPGNGTPKLGWILWHVFEQQIRHRGECYLYLSLLGMERPETDRPS